MFLTATTKDYSHSFHLLTTRGQCRSRISLELLLKCLQRGPGSIPGCVMGLNKGVLCVSDLFVRI